MDFSQFNAAEQAHMTKIIEKKQVSNNTALKSSDSLARLDARLLASLLWSRGEMLQFMLQRFHQQGSFFKRGFVVTPPSLHSI